MAKAVKLPFKKGSILSERELDDAVHLVQLQALLLGMIPIAGVMSRRVKGGKHEVLGFGFNHLREGIPGIHGETRAIMNMGRVESGYREIVATSSLNPCPFCQRTLAAHLGVGEVRILDTVSYSPDYTSYKAIGLTPVPLHHQPTIDTFKKWVNDKKNALIWNRDIGLFDGNVPRVFDVKKNRERVAGVMRLAHHHAAEAVPAEAPIGAVIIDAYGEVIGAGHAKIAANNDPSMVAAMSAWRACGAREHWMDKTLLLTAGPDHIAYSMFHIFNFGQLVIASDKVFAGQILALRKLKIPVHVVGDTASDALLKKWIGRTPIARVREWLGSDFSG
jgi:tRNA(Arg) A34 adenosine deaminase TadA